MSLHRLYLDEDAMDGDLVRGLRSGGLDVATAAERGDDPIIIDVIAATAPSIQRLR